MASSRSSALVPLPNGDLFSLGSARGFKQLGDGRILLPGDDNSPVAVFDPDEFDGVDRDEVVKTFRKLIMDQSRGQPVVLPDWLKLPTE